MNWISVKDRLPEEELDVLVWWIENPDYPDGVCCMMRIDQSPRGLEWCDDEGMYSAIDCVSHWMSLPEGPQ